MSRFLMAGVARVGLSAGFARAELLLDTLTSELDGTVLMSAANDRRSAQSFTTSASTTSLSQVSLDLSALGITSFDVALHLNFEYAPASRLEYLARPHDITLTSPYVISSLTELVAPSTQHWIVVQRIAGADISWDFTDNQGVANGFRSGPEGLWNITSADSLRTGVVAVPEPTTCAMALAGLACGGYSLWRRRTRRLSAVLSVPRGKTEVGVEVARVRGETPAASVVELEPRKQGEVSPGPDERPHFFVLEAVDPGAEPLGMHLEPPGQGHPQHHRRHLLVEGAVLAGGVHLLGVEVHVQETVTVVAPNHRLRRAVTALAIGNVSKRAAAAPPGHGGDGHATGGCCDKNQKPPLARHLPDCVGQADGAGRRGVSA